MIVRKTAGPQPRHPFLLVFARRKSDAGRVCDLPAIDVREIREPRLRRHAAGKRSLAEDRQPLVRAR